MPGDGPALNEAILETWDSLHEWVQWARQRPSVQEAGSHRFALLHVPSRPPTFAVGGTGLHRMDWSVPRFEIGYWVRRSCERKGYVTEAVQALVRLAFKELGAERVEIHCSHLNDPSQRVAERCGFVLECRLRNQKREPGGELRDTLVYALVRSDAAVRAALGGERTFRS